MGFIDRIWRGTESFHTAAWLWDKLPMIIGTAGSAALSAWATAATVAIERYSPISWVLGAFLGAILFLLAYLIWAAVRIRLLRYRLAADAAARFPAFNPLETTFTKQRIDVSVFKTPLNEEVRGRTFVDCELRGPMVVLFQGHSTLVQPGFINCDFVRIRVGAGAAIFNALPFRDITARGCKLVNLTILVPEENAAQMPAGANWITR